MLSYTEFIKENFSKTYSGREMPKEGGCCLILSKPYLDGLKRLFIGIIDKVRGPREVTFLTNFYIVKEYKDGIIWAENAGDVRRALNMKTTGLTLNNNKTPLWYNSIKLSKNEFLKNNQLLIKDILKREDIFTVKSDKPYQ
jgi:hypothetical protein